MAQSAASDSPSEPPSPTPSEIAEQAAGESELSTAELLERLRQDRLWLLRQIDSGRWTQWRLDLAALERELGQLLEQAAERCGEG
ncbi:MAG: hypothetical protein ACK55X_02965 [Synechococcaceae cyanobacterium]|jgi:hypothetical protein